MSDEFTDLLIPYCDGELSAEDSRRVESHLAACPGCQRELDLLNHSLELARSIWQQSAALSPVPTFAPSPRHPVTPSPARRVVPRRLVPALAGIAAIALFAVATWVAWPRLRGQDSGSGEHAHASVSMAPGPPVPRPPSPAPIPDDLDPVAYVAREGRKARLQASIAILATEPSLKEYKERAERYLFEAYPETAPGGQPAPGGELRTEEPKS